VEGAMASLQRIHAGPPRPRRPKAAPALAGTIHES
jgi:hypothetical protein